jgi:hypothetical protein
LDNLLPTKDNLVHRSLLHIYSLMCLGVKRPIICFLTMIFLHLFGGMF